MLKSNKSTESYEISNKAFIYSIIALFLLSQALVHALWAPVDYQGSIITHAGEAFEAYHGALNIERFGLKWWGLQDMATNPAPDAHPYFYIHHPNFGMYYSIIGFKLGITSFKQQMAISSIFWSFGIVVFAVLVWQVSSSQILGVASAALVGLDPQNAFLYGCNIHRAADFASASLVVLASFLFIVRPDTKKALLLIFALLLAVGADYILFIYLTILTIVIAVVLPHAILFNKKRFAAHTLLSKEYLLKSFKVVALISSFALSIFAARQVQVIGGAGLEIWKHDFLYQILNRTHKEELYKGKWQDDTSSFYSDNNILNPGFAPKNSVSERFVAIGNVLLKNLLGFPLAKYFVEKAWVSLWLPFFCFIFLGLGLLSYIYLSKARKPLLKNFLPLIWDKFAVILVGSSICALAIMAFGMPSYFTLWFPEFRLPLFLASLIGALLTGVAFRSAQKRLLLAGFTILLIGKLISLPYVNQQIKKNALDHIEICKSLAGQTIFTNFTSASVASFSRSTACVPTLQGFEKLAAQGKLTEPSDFRFLLEKDAKLNPNYYTPKFVILFRAISNGIDDADVAALRQSAHFIERVGGNSFAFFERVPSN